jgi:trans-aconitate 2-methyltransferase
MTSYQWNALDYEKNSSQQQLWARELIAKLHLQGDEIVLDVGCGDGKVTAEIAAQLPHGSVLGVDVSSEMIVLARQRHSTNAHPNLRFQVADASHLPFQAEFTRVFSNAALHWVRDHRPVLQGIARSLKEGGRILLQMGGQGNAIHIREAIDPQMEVQPYAPYFADFRFPFGFHGPDEYTVWLREAGLNPLRVELIPKDMVHNGQAGLEGWLRTTHLLPYTAYLPEALREPFVAQVAEAYLARFPLDKQGRAQVHMVRLEVEAERA